MSVNMVDYCQSPVLIFFSPSVGLPVSRIIPTKSLLVFPKPFVSYLDVWYRRGVGASCGNGIVDGLLLFLGGYKVSGYWLGRCGKGGEAGCAILGVVEGGGPGGGVGASPIPFIKYLHYLFSRTRCAHNFNDPY